MISHKECKKMIPSVETVENSENNKFILVSIYKALHLCVRLILDVRTNQMKEKK